jgi:hypothetical protein
MPSVNYMVNAMSMSRAERVLKTIQKSKRMLVEHHGGECLDCGFVGPPFIYDFDHRDPTTKSFRLASKKTPPTGPTPTGMVPSELIRWSPRPPSSGTHRRRSLPG